MSVDDRQVDGDLEEHGALCHELCHERRREGSLVDEVEPRIRGLLRVTPTMPATVCRGADRLVALDPDAAFAGERAAPGVLRPDTLEGAVHTGPARVKKLAITVDGVFISLQCDVGGRIGRYRGLHWQGALAPSSK